MLRICLPVCKINLKRANYLLKKETLKYVSIVHLLTCKGKKQ